MTDRSHVHHVRNHARPLGRSWSDYDGLIGLVGSSNLVLIGEATEGTHEFHRERIEITKRLIAEEGFNAVVVEADWPEAYRISRFIRGENDDREGVGTLAGLQRFPAWEWRNADVLDFIGWLRDHNKNIGLRDHETGFYSLDSYSLHKSMNEVVEYLEDVDLVAAHKTRQHYDRLESFGPDRPDRGLLTAAGISNSCHEEIIRELVALRASETRYLARSGTASADDDLIAEQSARLASKAEAYYREMFLSESPPWNFRQQCMAEELVDLLAHLQSHHGRARAVVWAHNSHLGDARATSMGRRGEVNIGQLLRDEFPTQCKLIGFTTYTGTVTASSGWLLPAEHMNLSPGLDESYEHLFHQVGIPRFWLDLTGKDPAVRALKDPRLERAIGVVYQPENERQNHYFQACLPDQFDAVIHLDLTRAVEPIDYSELWGLGESRQTLPSGI